MDEQIKPFIPTYAREPNKVIEYFEERFDDGVGHTATITKVRYIDTKKKKEHIVTAFVKWD